MTINTHNLKANIIPQHGLTFQGAVLRHATERGSKVGVPVDGANLGRAAIRGKKGLRPWPALPLDLEQPCDARNLGILGIIEYGFCQPF